MVWPALRSGCELEGVGNGAEPGSQAHFATTFLEAHIYRSNRHYSKSKCRKSGYYSD